MEDSHILFIGSSTINDPVLNHITAENVDGSNCSETIKCSNGSNGTISVFGKAIGGYEDVLDVNRGNNCSFFIHEALIRVSQQKYFKTFINDSRFEDGY